MSDFIYSKKRYPNGELSKEILAIYHQDQPSVKEFNGDWGSLAVSHNLYNGFQSYETTEHICLVLGGPVFCFQDNNFLTENDEVAGTCAIYQRWLSKLVQWDEDLSGPFVFLVVTKKSAEITCVTDLMSFIPVFVCQNNDNVMLSTHIDALARASGQSGNIDIVSQVDFILNGLITYPYTAYCSLRQIAPATIHNIPSNTFEIRPTPYWLPDEKEQFSSLDQAATELRNGLQNYVNAITVNMPVIAQFISGGEDSRALSSLLPEKSRRDAFIFLDGMNREGKLAKKTAEINGANFNYAIRTTTHYIDILPDCANLVGSGAQFNHVHTFGFHKSCNLSNYPAVFGGFMSDTLLKGLKIKKLPITYRLPFLPQIELKNYSSATPLMNNVFTDDILRQVTNRRIAHLEFIQSIRAKSAEEWFYLWPISMQVEIPNVHGNRRLFKSYEPFMCKEAVKVSAKSKQQWKLNRRLFHRAAKPLLKKTKWILHGDGRLPFFSWHINFLVQFIMWFIQYIGRKTSLVKGNQGPWAEWSETMNSSAWKQAINNYKTGKQSIEAAFIEKNMLKIFHEKKLTQSQLVNLLQVLYTLHKR
jgi:hypothetical protein